MIKSIIDYLIEVKGLTKKQAFMWVLIPQLAAGSVALVTGTYQFFKYAAVLDAAYSDIQNIKQRQVTSTIQVGYLTDAVIGLGEAQMYSTDNLFIAIDEYNKPVLNVPLITRIKSDVVAFQEKAIKAPADSAKKYRIVVIPMNRNK
jgi:hypothetical protein